MQIVLNNIEKSFGYQNLFSFDSLIIPNKEKVAIVGGNGCGKTTLLRMIASKDIDFEGSISKIDPLKLGFLSQDLNLKLDSTIYEEALLGAKKYIELEEKIQLKGVEISACSDVGNLEKLNEEYHKLVTLFENIEGYKYKSLVSGTIKGLGFSEEDFTKEISTLSGGQKMRVALAKLLISAPEVLILDEPTNYLDTSSIMWLEGFLASLNSTMIVVSHDRYFLDKVCSRVVEIENKKIYEYKGNYTQYLQKKTIRLNNEQLLYEKQQQEIKKQKEVITTLKSFNREKSVRRARSREKQLEKMDVLEQAFKGKSANIRFKYLPQVSKKIIEIEDLSFFYKEDKLLFDKFNVIIKNNDKVGVCGKNAIGKTTLLKLITENLTPKNGIIKKNLKCKILYFEQEHKDLNPEDTIMEQLRGACPFDDVIIRNTLGAMLFSDEDVYKKIKTLSGGEKSRVALCKLMLMPSNVLVLDEPTNHLDIQTKELLEEALLEYEGCIISVSHDRYFLNKVCNKIINVEGRDTKVIEGSYDYAMNKIKIEDEKSSFGETQKEKKEEAKKTKLSNNKKNAYINESKEIEEEIAFLSREKEDIEEKLSDKDFSKDFENVTLASQHLKDIEEKISKLEDRWLEISLILEEENII